MRTRRSLMLMSLLVPLILMQLDLTGCLPDTGGRESIGGPVFNVPPTVVLSADVVRGIAPLTVRFSSAGSTDDGLIVSRLWNFGDGQTSRDISPVHTFQTTGNFTVRLTLTDDDQTQTSRSQIVAVTQAPVAVISVDHTTAESAPAVFNFDGSGSSDPDGTIEGYRWDFGDGSRELVPVVVHTFATPGTYRVRLTVTDNTGVTGSSDKIIQVGIPRPTVTFRDPPPNASNVAVSPDSPLWVRLVYQSEPGVPRTIRAGLDGDRDPCQAQAVIYDSAGNLERRLTGHDDRVSAVAFSPDGTLVLTASDDTTLRLYNAATGDLARGADGGNAGRVSSVAFSPDGGTYVHGVANGLVTLRNTQTGNIIRDFTAHALAVNGVAFSPDGIWVGSASDDTTALIYDAATGAIVQTLDDHEFAVTAIAFSPVNPDLVLTGSVDQTAKLWRIQDGAVLQTLAGGHTNAVTAVAFSPDGQFVLTGSDDATAKLWDTLGSTDEAVQTFDGHRDRVTSVAFSPDGLKVITGSVDGTAIVWDVATGESLLLPLQPCTSTISSVAFSADGTRILVGVAARNDIQLDSVPPTGNDMNLTLPTPLDLSILTDDDYPAQYFLWAELDTDRTSPVRTYADPTISVIRPYTASVDEFTPRIPLVNDEALVVVAPTSTRQIFDLGPLREGDRLYLSLLTTPGYGQTYDADLYSVLVMDAQEEVFTWYQEAYVLFSPDAKLIIGHDSPSYFVVVDGCQPPTCFGTTFGQSVSVRVERNVRLVTRAQRIFLNFAGGESVSSGGLAPVVIRPFIASDLNDSWGEAETTIIKAGIVARMNELYAPYNIVISTSDGGPPPPQPFQTLLFGGQSLFLYGIAAYIDPRNETLTGSALVATLTIAADFPAATPAEMGLLIGNVAAHEAGHLLGLRHTEGGAEDMMDNLSPITSTTARFMSSPLYRGEQYNGQIGTQDVPRLFEEIVGLRP